MPKMDITRALAQIVTDMKSVNARLTDLDRNWVDPPEPDKPTVRSELGDVVSQAASSTALANDMLTKLG